MKSTFQPLHLQSRSSSPSLQTRENFPPTAPTCSSNPHFQRSMIRSCPRIIPQRIFHVTPSSYLPFSKGGILTVIATAIAYLRTYLSSSQPWPRYPQPADTRRISCFPSHPITLSSDKISAGDAQMSSALPPPPRLFLSPFIAELLPRH